jgi:hypothetical protein
MAWLKLSIENVDGFSLKEGSTSRVLRSWFAGRSLEKSDLFRTLAIMSHWSKKLTIVLTDMTLRRSREPHCVGDQSIEHRLELRG